MRTESISMATVPRVAVVQLRGGSNDGDELFNIEGLTPPDDMRSNSRASRRSISERSHSAYVNGWVAVALTALGTAGAAAAAYLAFYDAAFETDPPPTAADTHIRYAVGGTMGALSLVLVASGLRHACRCVTACRGEPSIPRASSRHASPITRDTEAGSSGHI
ncbi:hypothetical protein PIN31115_01191 [Pandoraea iniqua]|uniref:Uncharacterized protein n=1 Tax=Pandoraea iniqua TaxID=2508288 RepID=A0A5E4T5V6_9BURK|nr:hypothetical protein [Pandoraea iniqua]VVD82572.1 hypothetical protein PIN31115_01191 [Pandoraea iniqua]